MKNQIHLRLYFINSITCTAPSKTFNIAGLKTSNIIIANEEYRKKVNRSLNINEAIGSNIFGIEVLIAAYNEGEEWDANQKIWHT